MSSFRNSRMVNYNSRVILVIIFIFLPGSFLIAQNYKLHIKVAGYTGNRAYLASLRGDESMILDSAFVNTGEIEFTLDEQSEPGLYRVYFNHPSGMSRFKKESQHVDLIFNHEDIDLITSYYAPVEDMQVIASGENLKYFNFLKIQSLYRRRLGLLLSLMKAYSQEEDFFNDIYRELLRIQKVYNDTLVLLSDRSPGMLSSSLISLYREPVYDPVKDPDLNAYMQENYLKPVSFNDPRLIQTPAVTRKILTYLSFYQQPGSDPEKQELAFIRAVDKIMAEVSYNELLYDFVLNYLIDGFEQFQMERVLVHIADNYLTGECKTEDEEIVRERLEAYKRMAPGNSVPDINLLDPDDKPSRLSDNESERTLLVFWSSECPHCTHLMPRLAEWYREEKDDMDVDIYAVSIDKNRADWEEFVLMERLGFTNVYDPGGWESKTSRQFNLYATPTMFLLDRNMRIISKPLTFREFRKEISK